MKFNVLNFFRIHLKGRFHQKVLCCSRPTSCAESYYWFGHAVQQTQSRARQAAASSLGAPTVCVRNAHVQYALVDCQKYQLICKFIFRHVAHDLLYRGAFLYFVSWWIWVQNWRFWQIFIWLHCTQEKRWSFGFFARFVVFLESLNN